MNKTKKQKTAILNFKEDKFWVKTFGYYKSMGYSDLEADKITFIKLVKEFPRLKRYTNIK